MPPIPTPSARRRLSPPTRLLPLLAILVGLAALPLSARAGGTEVEAEHDRLSDEMDKLAQRQVWSGVERKYSELEKLEIELTFEDYLNGAYAARELGEVGHAYERLKNAARKNGTRDVVEWLWDIDNNYGNVELISVPSRSAVLEVQEMPFDPNARKAADAAVESAKTDGIFVGMLPKGSYVFAGQPFTVEPGVSVRIEVSPKARRQGIQDPVIIYRELPGSAPTVESPPPSQEE